jgi:hypothetical protein
MSGWIKVEKSILSDIRFRRMVREYCNACALHEYTAVTHLLGALTQLWIYADEHIRDDDTMRGTFNEIDDFIGIKGFCDLMPRDWLVIVDSDNVQLPDWLTHNGSIAKKRALTQQRVERYRNKPNGNASPLHDSISSNAQALPDQTRLSHPRLDHLKPQNQRALKTLSETVTEKIPEFAKLVEKLQS